MAHRIPLKARLAAILILSTLPVSVLIACIVTAAREGLFDDFGWQLRELTKMALKGERA